MNEKDLDQILNGPKENLEAIESQKQFQKKIKRVMNRTIYLKTAGTVLLIGILLVCLFIGTSQVTNLLFYRPDQESTFLNHATSDDTWENEEFSILFEDTVSTYFPGTFCWMLEPLRGSGFGQYSAPLLITDAYGPHSMGPENSWLHISFSKLDTGHAPLAVMASEFIEPEQTNTNAVEGLEFPPIEDIRQELQNLPKSAYLDVSLSFPKSINSEEVAEIINDSSDIFVRWLALEGQNTTIYNQAAGGMFVTHSRGIELSDEAAAKYPSYELPEAVTGADLERCLRSRIQMLLDHPEFVGLMETRFPDLISISRLEERMSNAQNTWACYGMRVVGSPEAIEELMDTLSVTYARINNVKISRYQK